MSSSKNKNPPVLKPSRRSGRRRGQEHDPVIAPGFGTKTDIEKLSHDLSVGSDATLPAAAVEGRKYKKNTLNLTFAVISLFWRNNLG